MNMNPVNVAEHLARMAAVEPDRPALHVPARGVRPSGHSEHRTLTFRQLNDRVDRIAHSLDRVGVQRGVRTVLMVPPSEEFFALTFALLRVGAVPVLIDPGMGVRNLGRCLAEAEPQAFIGVPQAHLARRLLGWAKKTVRTTINVGKWRLFCDYSLDQLQQPANPCSIYPTPEMSAADPAAVLFTSGSTGVAKGAEYTHGIFAAQVESLKKTFGIVPGEVDLCTFPLFALFGPALGMTSVVPDMDFTRPARIDPRKAIAQIDQFGVTNLFGSPAVVRALGTWGLSREWRKNTGSLPPADADGVHRDEQPPRLPTLRRVISAGAPATATDLERLARLLRFGVEVFTPYGATEALPVANIGSREILTETRHLTEQGQGVCVGRPVAEMVVHVIRITDEPIAEWHDSLCVSEGEVGEFVVRGAVVTKRYFHRPEATTLAKMTDPQTGEVLHRMGDVGYVDERGRLWFCGRKSHRVVTPWGTLFTDMVEPVFHALAQIDRTALVGVQREGVTYPVLCWEGGGGAAYRGTPAADPARIDAAFRAQAARFDHTRRITTFLKHPAFPMDVRHNSKIFREQLAVWADKHLGPNWKPVVPA